MVEADDVLELLDHWDQASIKVWVDGGWGVDALVGHQTRGHADLDIALPAGDVERFNSLMAQLGFVVDRVDNEHNWVLIDPRQRLVDVHVVDLDDSVIDHRGVRVHGRCGLPYDVGALDAAGTIAGTPVRCCTASFQVNSHTGYTVDADDYRDVLALHEAFGLPIPSVYIEAGFHPTASKPTAPRGDAGTADHEIDGVATRQRWLERTAPPCRDRRGRARRARKR